MVVNGPSAYLLPRDCDLPAPPAMGQEVELLGDAVSLGEVAERAGTNEYEILTRLRRVPRSYEG